MTIQESGVVYSDRQYKASRDDVYDVINGERNYQKVGRGNALRHTDQPPMTTGEYILCMEETLRQAREAWYKPDGDKTCLDAIRKTTALGVAAMEIHGAPQRL